MRNRHDRVSVVARSSPRGSAFRTLHPQAGPRSAFERLRRGGRGYAAAALLNLALLNTVLTPPVRRPVVQARVVAASGPFSPTELLVRPGGEIAGVLARPLDPDRARATPSLN
jgi:hypothetical protein